MRVHIIAALVVVSTHAGQALAQDVAPTDDFDAAGSSPAEVSPQPPPSVPPPAVPPAAVATNLGGVGESCRARSDCEARLRCFANTCRDSLEGTPCGATSECGPHLRCFQQTCQTAVPARALGVASAEAPPVETVVSRMRIDGVHGFIGVSLMTGPVSGGSVPISAFLAAVRAGIYVGIHEFAIEIAPYSLVYAFDGPQFQANASYAVLIPMMRGSDVALYWPLRFGGGLQAFTGGVGDVVRVEGRADVLGLAIQLHHVMIDLHLPSFRFGLSPSGGGGVLLSWFGGASFSYMF